MDARECYEVWAPADGAWSEWAKPTLFTDGARHEGAPAAVDVSWAPDARERTALVIDFVGYYSVDVGLSLADRGYWPVPLFNGMAGPSPVVRVDAIQSHLFLGAERLRAAGANGVGDRPPVFLLDAGRLAERWLTFRRRVFDNRWVVFPQDFPSAQRLKSAGIKRVLIVTRGRERLRLDVAEVASDWMREGMDVWRRVLLDEGRNPEVWWRRAGAEEKREWQLLERDFSGFWGRLAWYVTRTSLQRSGAGSFGRMVQRSG